MSDTGALGAYERYLAGIPAQQFNDYLRQQNVSCPNCRKLLEAISYTRDEAPPATGLSGILARQLSVVPGGKYTVVTVMPVAAQYPNVFDIHMLPAICLDCGYLETFSYSRVLQNLSET